MKTYIALLRGINVSGQKKIKMNELAGAMAEIELAGIKTYIQSGNLVFQYAATDPKEISDKISGKIKERFTFDVPVVTIELGQWKRIMDENPFIGKEGVDQGRLYFTFLDEHPSVANLEKLQEYSFEPDEYIVKEKAIYLYCPHSYGNTKLNNNFFEQKLKVKATSRNLKTVITLYDMAASL